MEKLSGDYIAGFVDGEGCFALKFRRDIRHDRKSKPVYFYWDIEFAIVLRADDKEILEAMKSTLNCGRIGFSKDGSQARYSVSDLNDLTGKIVPFFEWYPLRAKKRFDFLLWREALNILKRNQQPKKTGGARGFQKISWRLGDINRLKKIVEEMAVYKSKRPKWKWL